MPLNSSPQIKGNNSVLWGTNGVYSGIITRGNKKTTGDKVVVRDNDGFTVTTIYFDDRGECSFEMIVQSSAPGLNRGDVITVAGLAGCLVEDTEEMWSEGQVRKFSVTAVKYAKI